MAGRIYNGEQYNTPQAAAFARARDLRADREQDARDAAALRERNAMSQKQTKFGPVPKPPDLSADDTVLDDWRGLLDDALDTARTALDRQNALPKQTADRSRFTNLAAPDGGGDNA